MLNINIFHEKATGKEEECSQERLWSPLEQIKEIAVFTTQVHVIHFQSEMHLFSKERTAALVLHK